MSEQAIGQRAREDAGATRAEHERASGEHGEGLRFEDPYWDDAFCAWWDPSLRTCC